VVSTTAVKMWELEENDTVAWVGTLGDADAGDEKLLAGARSESATADGSLRPPRLLVAVTFSSFSANVSVTVVHFRYVKIRTFWYLAAKAR